MIKKEFTTGGRGIGFTASVDLRLRRGDWLANGTGNNKEVVGQVVKFKIEKNKTFKRMQTGEFDFYFTENDEGIPVSHNDNFKSIILEGVAWGIIERAGAWFYLNKDTEQEEKFNGTVKLIEYLREQPQVVDNLKAEVMKLVYKSKED